MNKKRTESGKDPDPTCVDEGLKDAPGTAKTEDLSNSGSEEDKENSLQNLDPITTMLFGESPTPASIRSTVDKISNTASGTSLSMMVTEHDTSISEILIGTALQLAARNGRYAVAKLLVEAGGEKSSEAIEIATEKGHISILKLLFEKQPVDYDEEQYLLSEAARHGHPEIVEFYLQQGFDIDSKGASEFNPLKAAARSGCVDVVRLLLRKGAMREHMKI